MDPQTIANCRLASKDFKKFIDNNKALYIQERFAIQSRAYELISERNRLYRRFLHRHIHFERQRKMIERDCQLFKKVFNNEDLRSILIFMRNHWVEVKLWSYEECLNIFQLACYKNEIEIVKAFLKAVTPYELSQYLFNKKGPIKFQYFLRYYDVIKIIIEYLRQYDIRINMNMVDNQGSTPLHHACHYGSIKTVRLLIDYHETTNSEEIKLNVRNDDGETPLKIARLQACRLRALGKAHKNIISLLNQKVRYRKTQNLS